MDLAASREELEASDCDLCKLFAWVAPKESESESEGAGSFFNSNEPERLHLRALSSRRVMLGKFAHKYIWDNVPLLAVVQINVTDALSGGNDTYEIMGKSMTRILFFDPMEPRTLSFGLRSVQPDAFDVDFARSCIAFCWDNHGTCCKRSTSEAKGPGFLKVIDCRTRKVITAPRDCSYAALSYVWESAPIALGQDGIERGTRNSSTFDGCPKIISDAMEVTSKIDLLYLWVDRYCIDQGDTRDKHNQIRQMDLIYANAKVTIIAATTVLENGLPGVAGVQRPCRPSLHIGGHRISSFTCSSTWREAMSLIEGSKWATRGWTYQEGLLSKRRLIFTDEQVVFACNGMGCLESEILPLDDLHNKKKKTFKRGLPLGSPQSLTPGTAPYEIMRHISEFAKRDLTFATDRVNAMRGIFHVFETRAAPVHQLMGVPILPPSANKAPNARKVSKFNKEKFLKTLEYGFLIGLMWSHRKPGKRITHFPSWSWAGWSGELEEELTKGQAWPTELDDTNVWIEMEVGMLSPFPSLEILCNVSTEEPLGHLQFIHLDAYALPCSTVQLDEYGGTRFGDPDSEQQYVKATGEDDSSLYLPVYWDMVLEDYELSEKPFTGILVGERGSGGLFGRMRVLNIALLIVEEFDGYAERVAISSDKFAWWKAGYDQRNVKKYNGAQLWDWVCTNAKRRRIRLG